MIEVLHEFIVKDEAHAQFELAFGPGGAWSQIFARQPGFRGLSVLHETTNPRRYLTVEVWDSLAARDRALAEHAAGRAALDAQLDGWIESRSEAGVFRMLAEATIRPHPKAGRAKTPMDASWRA